MAGETGSGKTTQCPNFILEARLAVLEEVFILFMIHHDSIILIPHMMVLGVVAF